MSKRTIRFDIVGAALLCLVAAAAAAGGVTVSPPPYPAGLASKPLTVNVVTRRVAGEPVEATVLFCDGGPIFVNAAVSATKNALIPEGCLTVTLWFQFRLMEPTLVTDVTELGPSQLDAQPELVKTVKPTFPPGAPSLRTEVPMNLFIGTDGKVWYAEATSPDIPTLYAERALEAARQFEFTPATRNGKPTAFWFPFVIDFK